MSGPIHFHFGIPQHGWLPVNLHFEDFHLDFAASDVLNDPVEELLNAVLKLREKESREITWWLEPGAYFFELTKNGEEITLTVSEKDDLHNNKEEKKILKVIVGSSRQIIDPLKQALKKFSLKTYEENHWPYQMEKHKVEAL